MLSKFTFGIILHLGLCCIQGYVVRDYVAFGIQSFGIVSFLLMLLVIMLFDILSHPTNRQLCTDSDNILANGQSG